MAQSQQQILQVLAGELRNMSRDLEALGKHLCSDPAIVGRHIGALQRIDHIAQSQVSIADIIAGDDAAAACRSAPLEHISRHATPSGPVRPKPS